MSDQPIRKTHARVSERARARKQTERRDTITRVLPFVIAAAVVLFVGIVVFLAANQATPGAVGARLEVDREQVDLGNRIFDQPVRATFTVKNVGDGALKLDMPRLVTALEGC
ncbi:MAG: hypothetical protein HY868_17215 [Chloroflexi bacterium]|nr:hypothetical protein [Chloroflexota bacterium]